MSKSCTIDALFESAALPGGSVSLRISFDYTAPGPSGGTYSRSLGGYLPPDPEEMEFAGVAASVNGCWLELADDDDLYGWAVRWFDDHQDDAREQAFIDRYADPDAAMEAARERRALDREFSTQEDPS